MAGVASARDLALTPALAASTNEPLIQIHLGPDMAPVGATVFQRVDAPATRIWEVLADVPSYAQLIPIIQRVRIDGDRATVSLRFRISFLSVGFEFLAAVQRQEGRSLELRWLAGEPRGICLRFEVLTAEGRSVLVTHSTFDVTSLGWVVKFFLRHHPEIQPGIHAGSALVLGDAIRRVAERGVA